MSTIFSGLLYRDTLPHIIIWIILIECKKESKESDKYDNVACQRQVTSSPLYDCHSRQYNGQGKCTDN